MRLIVIILFCVLCLGFSVEATPSFVVPADLPSAGLRILVPARSVEEPLSPLERRVYRLQRGSKAWTEDRYDPREIWLREHVLGQWRDAAGNRMRILQVRKRFPADWPASDVQRHTYDARMAKMPDVSAASSDVLVQWIEDYLASQVGEPHVFRHISHPVLGAARFGTASPQRVLYLVRVAMAQGGLAGTVTRSFVVDLTYSEDADVARGQTSFEQRFLRSLDVMPVRLPERSPVASVGDAQVAGEDRLARSRAEAHASVANLRDWRSTDVSDYVVLSDQRRGAHALLRDLERTLDPMRAAYAALVPPLQPLASVGVIRIFSDQDEYTRYVGEAFAWSAGLWSEARSELVIRPVDAQHYREAREPILRTIYHEAFHQYLSLATRPLQVGVWFNEGHAVFFESSALSQRGLSFEEHAGFGRKATGMPLERLFGLTYESFYARAEEQRKQHYASAWALVYYLRRSAASDPQFAFGGFLDAYLQALRELGNDALALKRVFESYPLAALQADFEDFWGSSRRRRAVLRAPSLPE